MKSHTPGGCQAVVDPETAAAGAPTTLLSLAESGAEEDACRFFRGTLGACQSVAATGGLGANHERSPGDEEAAPASSGSAGDGGAAPASAGSEPAPPASQLPARTGRGFTLLRGGKDRRRGAGFKVTELPAPPAWLQAGYRAALSDVLFEEAHEDAFKLVLTAVQPVWQLLPVLHQQGTSTVRDAGNHAVVSSVRDGATRGNRRGRGNRRVEAEQ